MINPHPTWEITDSTKLNCFLDCPRKFFYEFVLGWSPDASRHDLEFGEAWHKAMEHLLVHGYGNESIQAAYQAFITYYRQSFSEATDADYAPKNPGAALIGLIGYVKRYATDPHEYETIYTEVAGSVPVSKNRSLHFRLDALLQEKKTGLYRFREHKTTKSNSRQWYDQWALAIQLGTYSHVLYCLYGPEQIYGGEVNGAIFTKSKGIDFVRIPVRKTVEAMNVWHWTVCYWLSLMDEQYDLLLKAREDAPIMEAFPMNPGACTKYFGCAYHDFCCCWPNPLRHCAEPPDGFVEYRWNPAEREAKTVMNF